VEAPLAQIKLSKRVLITSDFNEQKFVDSFYKIEAALNLVLAIAAHPNQLARQQPV
jgi:hypothetical protein